MSKLPRFLIFHPRNTYKWKILTAHILHVCVCVSVSLFLTPWPEIRPRGPPFSLSLLPSSSLTFRPFQGPFCSRTDPCAGAAHGSICDLSSTFSPHPHWPPYSAFLAPPLPCSVMSFWLQAMSWTSCYRSVSVLRESETCRGFGGFPGGTSGKEPTCQCRRHKRCGFDPWVRKIPWRRAQQPTPVFLPGESHGHRSLAGYSL